MALVVLPKSLTAKTEAKASDVMADFNAIVTQVNGKLDLTNLAESLRNSLLPTGSVLAFAGAVAPTGFLLCQGQAVSRTTYAVLFSIVGTTYGAGNGTTTFNVPDLRGRVPVGPDAGAGRVLTFVGLGQTAGDWRSQRHYHANSGGTSVESIVHQHVISGNNVSTRHEGSGFAYDNVNGLGGGGASQVTSTESAFHTHALTGGTEFAFEGNGENMQPYLNLNWMIKI